MNHVKPKTRILAECAILCAISCVLSIYPKFKFLGQGGSITVCSMLPIIIASYRNGIKWGLLTGFAFALFQLITGASLSGLSVGSVIVSLLFDYLIAFTVLGLGGMFRGKLKSPRRELCLGAVAAIALRFVSSFISGFIVFGEYAEWFFGNLGDFGAWALSSFTGTSLSVFYSLVYNARASAAAEALAFCPFRDTIPPAQAQSRRAAARSSNTRPFRPTRRGNKRGYRRRQIRPAPDGRCRSRCRRARR